MNGFFDSQFKFYLLIWMSKTHYIYIIYTHYIYNDKQSSFRELLQNEISASIHEKVYKGWLLKYVKSAIVFHFPNKTTFFETKNEHHYKLCFTQLSSFSLCFSNFPGLQQNHYITEVKSFLIQNQKSGICSQIVTKNKESLDNFN